MVGIKNQIRNTEIFILVKNIFYELDILFGNCFVNKLFELES